MKRGVVIVIIGLFLASCDNETDYLVTIQTSYGEMKAVLYDDTPLHKENFIKIAKAGRYDSTLFYRIIKEFMIQGGDLSQTAEPATYTIPAEFLKTRIHRKGALAAARQPDQVNPAKASSGSQFYIVQGKVWTEMELSIDQGKLNNAAGTLLNMPGYDSLRSELIAAYQAGDFDRYGDMMIALVPDITEKLGEDVSKEVDPERLKVYTTEGGYPFLDDEYTVFGQVVEGLDVLDKLASVETVPVDRPVEPIYMKVTVEEVSRKKITKEYGIIYEEKQ